MFGLFKKKHPAEPDATLIVPRIKPTNFLAALRDIGTSPGDTPITEPLVADLVVAYALDLGETFEMVCPHHCQTLGIAHSQLRSIAIDNLRKQVGDLDYEDLAGGKLPVPLWSITSGNDLEACLVMLDDFWSSMARRVPGDMVVGLPARNALVITSTQSPATVQLLREVVMETHRRATNHSLTLHLLVRRGSGWEVFNSSASQASTNPASDGSRKPAQPGGEVLHVNLDEPAMAAAIAEARRRIPEFKALLESPQAGVTVRVPWVCGDLREVYEANLVGLAGDELEVEFTPAYAPGPVRTKCKMEKILDWTVYHDDGRQTGAFTTRAVQ